MKPRLWSYVVGIYLSLLIIGMGLTNSSLQAKMKAQKADKNVQLSVDWDDLEFFNLTDKLRMWNQKGLSAVTVSPSINLDQEKNLRQMGLHLIWRCEPHLNWRDFKSRFQRGDGLIITDEKISSRLYFPGALSTLLDEERGGFYLPDMSKQQFPQKFFHRISGSFIIRSHVIDRNDFGNMPSAMLNRRAVRAVKERWIRMINVRFSSVLSEEQNAHRMEGIIDSFHQAGFLVGEGKMESNYFKGGRLESPRLRNAGILLISVATPLLIIFLQKKIKKLSLVIRFLSLTAFTIISGLTIYSLGCVPSIASGVTPLRGIKFQLVAPLILSTVFIFSYKDLKDGARKSVRWGDLLMVGGLGSLVLFIYLARSGNTEFHLVPLQEKYLRDWMDTAFLIRPRFKEFLIGHPLFIWGGHMIHQLESQHFMWKVAHVALWFGLIGQISILNSFTHIQAPLQTILFRSIQSLWMGLLFSIPLFILTGKRCSK